jgi:energy-coupling factor transporter ATP-binding protein EcfA2
MPKKVLEQHIAVFGESGSGKTVLLSSFYGLMREKQTQERIKLDVVADDAGQGDRLFQNYLGMSRDGRVPPGNRFSATPYSFTARLDNQTDSKKSGGFGALQFVWHDYPGEWFHQSPSGPEEEARRADTFRSLLESDVALVLVDGERMASSPGHEGEYLKLLLTNIRNGLLPVIEALAESGKPLARFPRIWMFALSKSDVLPDLTVEDFRELVVLRAAHEVDQLRTLLRRVILDGDSLAVGEDYVLLSSAKFAPEQIDVTQRVGVDLLMPIASVFPLERFLRWAEARNLRGKLAEALVGRETALAGVVSVLVGLMARGAKLPGRVGAVLAVVSGVISREMIEEALKLGGDKLKKVNKESLANGDYLRAALTQFSIDLEDGERQGVLLRSSR